MDKEIFEFIKSFVINCFNYLDDNKFGYVDEKINQINMIENNDEYSGMLVLNSLHVITRRLIINEKTPVKVIYYVTKHSKDLNEFLKDSDQKLIKSVERYKKLKSIIHKSV